MKTTTTATTSLNECGAQHYHLLPPKHKRFISHSSSSCRERIATRGSVWCPLLLEIVFSFSQNGGPTSFPFAFHHACPSSPITLLVCMLSVRRSLTRKNEKKAERKPLPKEPDVGGQLGGSSLDAQNEAAQQVFNEEALEACEHCGRTFMKDRLVIHQKSCTSSSPAARVGAARLSSSGASPEVLLAKTAPRPRVS